MGFVPIFNSQTQLVEEEHFRVLNGTVLVGDIFGSAVNWLFFHGWLVPCTRVVSCILDPASGGRGRKGIFSLFSHALYKNKYYWVESWPLRSWGGFWQAARFWWVSCYPPQDTKRNLQHPVRLDLGNLKTPALLCFNLNCLSLSWTLIQCLKVRKFWM